MWLELAQKLMWAVCGGLVLNWLGNWTSEPARRALRLSTNSLRSFWLEMQVGLAARRLTQLIKIQKAPYLAISDMLLALGVILLGGGYGLLLVIVILSKELKQLPVGTELFSLLGPGSLVTMGFYRLSDAAADLAQTERKIARIRCMADARGWDLDDAMVNLR
jgi:hypothetical protein